MLIARKLSCGGGGNPSLGSKYITANGTYEASDDNLDGYDEVTVNVPDTAYALLNKTIKEVILPNTATTLVDSLFRDCSQLSDVTFEEPSQITSIGNACFQNCSSLNNVVIPSSVSTYGQAIFQGCLSLSDVEIPSNITKIYGHMFYGCYSLASFTIPTSVTEIKTFAFNGCNTLSSIKIPLNVVKIENNAFNGCCYLTLIDCTELTETNGAVNTTLENVNAFYNGSNNRQFVFVDETTMNAYKNATNWSNYASEMTYVGA